MDSTGFCGGAYGPSLALVTDSNMKTRLTLAALTMIGMLTASGTTGASEKLTLRVTPNVSSAPSTVIVKAIVARHADNRWLHIEADSGEFFRSSAIQLDGDKAPVVTEIRLPNLPGGEYTVKAVLLDAMGDETIVRRTALVMTKFGQPR
jgi:hypothetical protein